MEAHIYLPPKQRSASKRGINIADSAIGTPRYESAFEDSQPGEIARAVYTELISNGRTSTSRQQLMDNRAAT